MQRRHRSKSKSKSPSHRRELNKQKELDKSRIENFDARYYRAMKLGRGRPLEGLGAGDSVLFFDVLPERTANAAFKKLREETEWVVMRHKGGAVSRLIAAQGTCDAEKDMEPIYRHPADELPPTRQWTETPKVIKAHVEKLARQQMNHALIQWYRGGSDHITPHTDKTIDIKRASSIVNVSIGAERVMVLREKGESGKRRIQRISLPHNSLFLMGWRTNREWLHGINKDNRPIRVKSESEVAEQGHRISLTFRQIATYLHRSNNTLTGQGAPAPEATAAPIPESKCQYSKILGTRKRPEARQELALNHQNCPRPDPTLPGSNGSVNQGRPGDPSEGGGGGSDEGARKAKEEVIRREGNAAKDLLVGRQEGQAPDPERENTAQYRARRQLFRAFGRENFEKKFDWEAHYGKGSSAVWISKNPTLWSEFKHWERAPELKLEAKRTALVVVSADPTWLRLPAPRASTSGGENTKGDEKEGNGVVDSGGDDDDDDGFRIYESRRTKRKLKKRMEVPSEPKNENNNNNNNDNNEQSISSRRAETKGVGSAAEGYTRLLIRRFEEARCPVARVGIPAESPTGGDEKGYGAWSGGMGLTIDDDSIQRHMDFQKIHTFIVCGTDDLGLLQATARSLARFAKVVAAGDTLVAVSIGAGNSKRKRGGKKGVQDSNDVKRATARLIEKLKYSIGARIVPGARDLIF